MIMADASEKFCLEVQQFIAAPPEKVFAAFDSGEKLKQWFVPKEEVRGKTREYHFEVGGALRIRFEGPDGFVKIVKGLFQEIQPTEKIVFSWIWEAENPDDEQETLVTIILSPENNGTQLTLTHEGLSTEETCRDHTQGWTSVVAHLGRWCE